MIGALVLNGEKYEGAIAGDYVVCCDGGYDKSERCDALIGDMDSISSVPKCGEITRLARDKDLTDGEAGLRRLIAMHAEEVIIYGLDGGRLDHILANIGLMEYALNNGVNKVSARCNGFDAYMLNGDITVPARINCAVSLAPITDSVHIMVTKGLKYAINDFNLTRGSSLSFSNAAISASLSVSVTQGKCLLVVNK